MLSALIYRQWKRLVTPQINLPPLPSADLSWACVELMEVEKMGLLFLPGTCTCPSLIPQQCDSVHSNLISAEIQPWKQEVLVDKDQPKECKVEWSQVPAPGASELQPCCDSHLPQYWGEWQIQVAVWPHQNPSITLPTADPWPGLGLNPKLMLDAA